MRLLITPLALALLSSCSALAPPTRRQVAQGVSAAIAGLVAPGAALAGADEVLVSGVASLAEGTSPTYDSETAALYLTIKKGAAPQQVIGLMKGAPDPALGAVRVPMKGLSFPYSFKITRADLFADATLPDDATNLALTVSARLDGDGVAATRGADDLVGSTFYNVGNGAAKIELTPRGLVSKTMK